MGKFDPQSSLKGESFAKELARSQARLEAVLGGMLDAVVTMDPYGVIQEVSNSVTTIFGYAPSELVGQKIETLMPEPHHSRHDEYLARYRETGETWILGSTREFEVLKKGGERIFCELSVSRIDIPGEAEPLFCGSFRDVTKRRLAERALAESEQRFRAIFDQEYHYVALLGPHGRVREINRAALAALGATHAEALGRAFWEIGEWGRSEEDGERLQKWVEQATRGEFVRAELEVRGVRDDVRTIDLSLKPVLDEGDEVHLVIAEGRDITVIKNAQRSETAMLRALATIGESAAVLAHEIKNPITAVNTALRAVAKQLGEDEQVVLQELVKRMERLERMMRRTLSFTKPVEIHAEACTLGELLEGPLSMLRPQIITTGVEVATEVAPDCPRISVDKALVEEVFLNLVRNSIEALERGGHVRIVADAGGEDDVLIGVEDDGPGIADSISGTLFRPFITTKSKGTGIGLAVCKKIVEEHGGSIVSTNSELGGARFEVRLPRASG